MCRVYDVKAWTCRAALRILGLGCSSCDRTGPRYEDCSAGASEKRPVRGIGFDPALAQRIYAGRTSLDAVALRAVRPAQLIALGTARAWCVRQAGWRTRSRTTTRWRRQQWVQLEAYDPWQFFAAVVRAWRRTAPLGVVVARSPLDERDVSCRVPPKKYRSCTAQAIANHRERRHSGAEG